MSRFSWEKRIRRAERLAVEYPASAEILRFYAQLARFQQSVYDRLKSHSALERAMLEPEFEPLRRLIERIGPPALAHSEPFFETALLQPYMECAVSRNIPCPACGERPQAAVLRGEGEGAKRWLLCSLCSSEWEFNRILCPNCGEQDPQRLPVFKAQEFAHVRIEACDTCRAYVKAIDLSVNGLAVPQADDLATVSLDLWAEESGCHKLQKNVLEL